MTEEWVPWLQRICAFVWPPNTLIHRNLFHPTVNPNLAATIEFNSRGRPTILFCHGNTGNIQTFAPLMEWIAQETGMRVVGFDYPGYGSVPGPCSEKGCFDAAEDIYQQVSRQVGDENIVFWGVSMGCGPAIYLASRHPRGRALVLEAPFTSAANCANLPPILRDALGYAAYYAGADYFANWAIAADVRCPVYIAHNSGDPTIPADHSKYLAATFANVQYFELIDDEKHTIYPNKKEKFIEAIKKISA